MDHEDNQSDYGSDIELDETLLQNLLSVCTQPPNTSPAGSQNPRNPSASLVRHGGAAFDARPHSGSSVDVQTELVDIEALLEPSGYETDIERELDFGEPSVKLEYPADAQTQASPPEETAVAAGSDDTRSPYERYRSRKKALSVTDLVSAVWCEQQFEYTLQQGFKTRTPQMQKGTEVHRKLEEQVHTVVEVRQVKTKEDRWGLKLFNMYHGLCSFEETGLTRELPVFGFMDDIFVQGVIDEVTYVNPEARLEAMTCSTTAKGEPRKRPKFMPENDVLLENSKNKLDVIPPAGKRTAYISDTKTRASKTAPSSSQTRQTSLQLMLYRDLLANMRNNNFDFAKFLDWFELNGNDKFSDGFIVEMASIGDQHNLEFFLDNNSLWSLWLLIQAKLEKCIDSVGAPLGVAYRTQTDGALIRFQVMQFDSSQLEKHMKSTMGWWKGSRDTVGVEIEEAWKCRSCEFADRCTWRLGKIEELKQSRVKGASSKSK